MSTSSDSTNKWYLLSLATATMTFAAAMPFSCMPVLFREISNDLHLSLAQIGVVWGMVGLAGVFVSLIAGVLGDKLGVRLVLGLVCLLGGFVGASRGMSVDFVSLALTVFAFGILRGILPINVHKATSLYFRGSNLGTANGVVSMGMGVGLMLGSMLSAAILSPLLGGWRRVLFLYGAASIALGALWLLSLRTPSDSKSRPVTVPILGAIKKLVRIKSVWLIGLTLMFRMGCIMGMTGYLPLYLRGRGWEAVAADSVLAGFYAVSALSVIPISLLSDRIGSRKAILLAASIMTIFGIGLVPIVNDTLVWVLVLATGVFMDAFMAVSVTLAQQIEGVGSEYSGTALGLAFTLSQVGGFLSPLLGNSLAVLDSGLPLLFWASLSLCAVIPLLLINEPIKGTQSV
ncbi:MAG: MFS transporter [Chloroflexota bacterium]